MPAFSRTERAALTDLLDRVGPSAPTLSGSWTTHELVAHLVLRERHPAGPLGVLAPGFGDWSVERLVASSDYTDLVEQVRTGPPLWSPFGWAPTEPVVNTLEFYIHHEDVRRAVPGWSARDLDASEQGQIWGRLRIMARLLLRRAPMPVVLQRTDDESAVTVNRWRSEEPVVVSGPPSELALFCYGRGDHCLVELAGPATSITTLKSTAFGL